MRGKLGFRSRKAPSSGVLLLKFNGNNNSTTFVDSSENDFNVTPSGDVEISTVESKYGGSSGSFFGSDGYLETQSNAEFDLSTAGELTVEAWIYPVDLSNGSVGIAGWHTASSDGRTAIIVTASLALSITKVGINNISTNSGVIVEDQWQHIAVVREYDEFSESYVTKLYVDGVEEASSYADVWDNSSNTFMRIGYMHPDNGYHWSGYIDDLRFDRTAAYRSAFTPPGELM